MSDVQMISVLITIVVIYLKTDIFISDIEIEGSKKSFKFNIRAKQKNGSPHKNDRS